jgi:hypothetical protein
MGTRVKELRHEVWGETRGISIHTFLCFRERIPRKAMAPDETVIIRFGKT